MPFLQSPGVSVSEVDLTTVIPGVATTVGAFAGVFRWGPVNEPVLIDTENKLIEVFGRPTNLNPETFFTAASFLGYSNALYVTRAGSTSGNSSVQVFNAVANTANVPLSQVRVLNRAAYETIASFPSEALYIAKFPGELGNSLRVSICDSANAYQTNVNIIGTVSGNTISGEFRSEVGQNTATFSFVSSGALSAANTFANQVRAAFQVGDILSLGNSTLGIQYSKITAVGNVSTNTTHAFFTVSFNNPNRLALDFRVANNENGNTTVATVRRNWEFFNLVSGSPGQSETVATVGNTAANDLLHVVVVDEGGLFTGEPGRVLEVFSDLSRARDAKTADGATIYYRTVINDRSKYLWWANDRPGAPSANAATVASSTNQSPLSLRLVGGSDGADEATIPIVALTNAYDFYKQKETIDISLLLAGKPRGGAANTQLANYLVDNIAEVRKDCIVFVSPEDRMVVARPNEEAEALVEWRNNFRSSSYAVIDSGYKYIYDRYNDVYRYVPLNGDIAGIVARSDSDTDPWISPAGFNRGRIRNIIKLRFNPNQAERDLLYRNGINPVVTFPGQGTLLYGDKTALRQSSAFDRINVRRLFIVLQKAISEAARRQLFEVNDALTRANFVSLVTPFLRDVQARRGITDFLVVCDETNNTPERIDRNEFWADIYIKPTRSINFIQLNFVAVRTGVEFSTVIGATP